MLVCTIDDTWAKSSQRERDKSKWQSQKGGNYYRAQIRSKANEGCIQLI